MSLSSTGPTLEDQTPLDFEDLGGDLLLALVPLVVLFDEEVCAVRVHGGLRRDALHADELKRDDADEAAERTRKRIARKDTRHRGDGVPRHGRLRVVTLREAELPDGVLADVAAREPLEPGEHEPSVDDGLAAHRSREALAI